MKLYNSQQTGEHFNLSVVELYKQLRKFKIISGKENKPAAEFLKAGYFVDRRKIRTVHMKFELTVKGLIWLCEEFDIERGRTDIKRECYHCKRHRYVTIMEYGGGNKRVCAECAGKVAAKARDCRAGVPPLVAAAFILAGRGDPNVIYGD